jgi:predicted GIY-YIG superfamily endonuclease
MPAKKKKQKPIYKVYIVTSREEDSFYIGMTQKVGKELENYFGSSKRSQSWPDKKKVVLYSTERKSEARLMELYLQLVYREDDRCVNDMLNVRINARFTKGLTDDRIEQVCEKASRVCEMRLIRRSSDVPGWLEPVLLMQLELAKRDGEIH